MDPDLVDPGLVDPDLVDPDLWILTWLMLTCGSRLVDPDLVDADLWIQPCGSRLVDPDLVDADSWILTYGSSDCVKHPADSLPLPFSYRILFSPSHWICHDPLSLDGSSYTGSSVP